MHNDPIFEIKDRLDLPGWLTRHGMTGEGVEVGVLFGEFSAHILANWPGILHMVDPWVNQAPTVYLDGCNSVDMEAARLKTLENVEPYIDRTRIWREMSDVTPGRLGDESQDMVYLDGNHKLSCVQADIAAFWPKIKRGGVLAGHDFYERHDAFQDCGVKEAVMGFVRENDLAVNLTSCTSWFIRKPL